MMQNRRKNDITCEIKNNELWEKWILESVIFFDHKENSLPEIKMDDITKMLKAA